MIVGAVATQCSPARHWFIDDSGHRFPTGPPATLAALILHLDDPQWAPVHNIEADQHRQPVAHAEGPRTRLTSGAA
jgi:hypothetical protein